MKSILDPTFRYVSSLDTDLRKTFARIRRERSVQQKAAAPKPTHARPVIVPMRAGSSA